MLLIHTLLKLPPISADKPWVKFKQLCTLRRTWIQALCRYTI